LGEKLYAGVVKASDVHPDEALPRSEAREDLRAGSEDGKVRDLERMLKGMEADNCEAMVPLSREEIYDRGVVSGG
jgi:hypothetical protein